MIYFIHLHHVTSRLFKESHLTGTTAGRDPTVAFLAQYYSTPLQKLRRGIVIQQPLYSREKLTDSVVYQAPAFFRF